MIESVVGRIRPDDTSPSSHLSWTAASSSSLVTSSDPARPSRFEKKNTLPVAAISLPALHLALRLLLTVAVQRTTHVI